MLHEEIIQLGLFVNIHQKVNSTGSCTLTFIVNFHFMFTVKPYISIYIPNERW